MLGMFIVANQRQDLQPQKLKKTVEFSSDMEHISFVSNLLKNPSISVYTCVRNLIKLLLQAISKQ